MGHWETTQGAGNQTDCKCKQVLSALRLLSALIRAQCAHLYDRGSQVSLWVSGRPSYILTQQYFLLSLLTPTLIVRK